MARYCFLLRRLYSMTRAARSCGATRKRRTVARKGLAPMLQLGVVFNRQTTMAIDSAGAAVWA